MISTLDRFYLLKDPQKFVIEFWKRDVHFSLFKTKLLKMARNKCVLEKLNMQIILM